MLKMRNSGWKNVGDKPQKEMQQEKKGYMSKVHFVTDTKMKSGL